MIIRNKKRVLATCVAIVIGIFLSASIGIATRAVTLQNNAIVEADSILTYTLNARYDSKDKYGNETTSQGTPNPNFKSDTFVVEDVVPEGLIVSNDVLDNADVSFSSSVCATTYNATHDNNTVRFEFGMMPSGCEVSITFSAETPDTTNNMHFHNTAYLRSGIEAIASNTVHDSIGTSGQTYTVRYDIGDVNPGEDFARSLLPADAEYEYGASVQIKKDGLDFYGYKFDGWYINDELITGDKFAVEGDTTVVAKWTLSPDTYNVYYNLGIGAHPDDYQEPQFESHASDDLVRLNVPTVGDVIDGYRFTGVTIDDPSNCELINTINPACIIKGTVMVTLNFEEATYNLSYEFAGDIPESAVLPSAQNIAPGTAVTLAEVEPVENYEFVGWNYDNEFEMPEEDLVIRGNWRSAAGLSELFRPTITAMIPDEKNFYILGETIEYHVIVTNPEEYDLYDLHVAGWNNNNEFIEGEGYEKQSDQYVIIPSLSAGSSVEIIAHIQVTGELNYTHDESALFDLFSVSSNYGTWGYNEDDCSTVKSASIKSTRELPTTGVTSGNKTIIIFATLALIAVGAICFILLNRFRVRLNYAKLGLGVFAISAITLGALVLNGSFNASAMGGKSNTLINENQGWTLDRSVSWADEYRTTMRVNYTFKADEKYTDTPKTIIYIVDSSISGDEDYFNNIAQGIEDNFESDMDLGLDNHYAVIMYNDEAGVESGYADVVDTTNVVDPCADDCGDFFYRVNRSAALQLAKKTLDENGAQHSDEIILVMISDERSTVNKIGEVAARAALKDAYENLTINAINVNTGTLNVHGNIADNAFYAKDTDMSHAMRRAANTVKSYSYIEIYDYFDNSVIANAEIENTSAGEAAVIDNRIVHWQLDGLETGSTATMSVVLTRGDNSTSDLTNISNELAVWSELNDGGMDYRSIDHTLDTYGDYAINYDQNLPMSCYVQENADNYIISEIHMSSEENIDVVPSGYTMESCDWTFMGWAVVDDDVEMTDRDTIKRLPGHDITVRAVWSKYSLTKSAAGTEVTP